MISAKVVSRAALKSRLAKARRSRRKIVFTNGVFDILHSGHLKTLEWSKRQGDVLVVGVNSDASVRFIKGPKRPLVPQGERALLVAGLEPVDLVTVFSEATPEKLIALVKPDVLVKGGDYKVHEIVGREHARKVVRIPLVRGRSTTDIVARVVDRYGK